MLLTDMAQAGLIDSINGGAKPPFVFYGGPVNIGWFYTPSVSYDLSGIFTTFRSVPNGTGLHTITVQIQSDLPQNGGSILEQGSFTGDSFSGGTLGANFGSSIHLTAGQSYFVDFLNTAGMGVNLGQWALDSSGIPAPSAGATTNLGAWYGDSGTGTNFSLVSGPAYYPISTGNVSFAEPILYFYGSMHTDPGPSPAPEPISLSLFCLGLTYLVLHRRTLA